MTKIFHEVSLPKRPVVLLSTDGNNNDNIYLVPFI